MHYSSLHSPGTGSAVFDNINQQMRDQSAGINELGEY
jgi:hypothetical protein